MTKAPRIAKQIAALPVRWDKKGKVHVLMVTSRDTGRWVMPKGWLMNGKKPWHAAKIEALEEAGAVGFVSDGAIGQYHYIKDPGRGANTLCEVTVYPMMVEKLKRRWKERKERKRRWFSLREAAGRVDEPELTALLEELARDPGKLSLPQDLREAS